MQSRGSGAGDRQFFLYRIKLFNENFLHLKKYLIKTKMKKQIRFTIVSHTLLICLLVASSCKDDTPEYSLDIDIYPEGSGTVSLSPDGGIYLEGSEVSLIPNASTTYKFKSWSGTDSIYISDNKIVMSKNMEIRANFEKLIQNGKWQGYYTGFAPTKYDIYFNIFDNKITKTGSTILIPNETYTCSMMLYLYWTNMYMTKYFYGDIQITNGSFSYTSGSSNSNGGKTTITGTFTSGNTCIGKVVFDEGSNHLDYDFTAQP